MLIVFHLSLMSAAVICLIAGVSIAMFLRKNRNRINLHKKINLTGFCFLLAGAAMALAAVASGGGAHAAGLHQRIGLTAILLACLTVFLGFYTFKARNKPVVRAAHRWSGRISIIAMLAALMLGLRMIGFF
ncbi:MAG: hypothetical protein R6W75_04115 [Smithellaceae bacterium]